MWTEEQVANLRRSHEEVIASLRGQLQAMTRSISVRPGDTLVLTLADGHRISGEEVDRLSEWGKLHEPKIQILVLPAGADFKVIRPEPA